MERFKNEFKGWQPWEVLWLAFNCVVILFLSIYWHDDLIGTLSALTGVAYVVFNGKGKLTAYAFGIANASLYAVVSYQAGFYGEVMLNIIYYLPMQFYGFYVWSKNMDGETYEVKKRKLMARGRVSLAVAMAVATVAYGFLLKVLGGTLPFVDSLSTIVSVFAMVMAIKMYMEQWALWFIVNAVSTVMWTVSFSQGGEHISALAMWALYLANSVVMYIKWSREVKKSVTQ